MRLRYRYGRLFALWPPSSTTISSTGPDTAFASCSACDAGTSRSCRPVTMKIGQVMRAAASFIVRVFATCRACISSFEWLRTRNVSRVSSGSPSQIFSHSNGPDSAMHALMRFSYAAARGA